MAKILILIGGHLCTAPRPQKEAQTLADAGHDVTVQGIWFDPQLVERDRQFMTHRNWRFEPILDFQPVHRFNHWRIRAQGRIARVQYQQFKTFSPDLLGYGARSMLKAARQFHADLTIVHSEAGLWVGNQLLSEGYRVGVDFEDWFSEDLLPDARAARPVAQLKQMERRLARECCYCLTTSHALAHALAHAYDAPKPTVIYNVFPWAEQEQIDHLTKDRKNLSLPSLHWFSQTIGPGRGLETLFQALSFLTTPAEIHLRGNYSDSARQWLEPLVPDEWHQHLFIHPTVSNAELLSRIAEHDIGLALEDNQIPSRNLTVTNKLFQYLQAGLAVVATDTAGQREVLFKSPQNSTLILSDDALLLAKKLEYLLQNPTQLKLAQEASLQLAKDMFCWDKQCAFLLQAVSLAIDPK